LSDRDTAGQERYRAITTAYYRGALGAMLVYDVTKLASFDNVPRWLRELKDHANRDIVLIQIGNKVDLANDASRQVTEQQAAQMATELDVPTIETSAKSGLNVDKAFISVIERIYQNAQLSKQSQSKQSVTNNSTTTSSDPSNSNTSNSKSATVEPTPPARSVNLNNANYQQSNNQNSQKPTGGCC
jgi:GTPase SAR1 family protein